MSTVSNIQNDPSENPSINGYSLIKRLNSGQFSHVFLTYKKPDPVKKYVLKITSLDRWKYNNLTRQDFGFHKIALLSKSPFVAQLYNIQQCATRIYQVKEYLEGGDLRSLLLMLGCLDINQVSFYSAEIISAISYLHRNEIIHRDICLDNILLTSRGHICLTDVGLDSWCFDYGFTVVPTEPGVVNGLQNPSTSVALNEDRAKIKSSSLPYLAPELLMAYNHGPEVDFWSLGVCMYQLFTGVVPFPGDTTESILDGIINYSEYRFEWPLVENEDISIHFGLVIRALLCRFPKERANDQTLQGMKLYKGLQWDDLYSLDPPYVPSISYNGQRSTSDEVISQFEKLNL